VLPRLLRDRQARCRRRGRGRARRRGGLPRGWLRAERRRGRRDARTLRRRRLRPRGLRGRGRRARPAPDRRGRRRGRRRARLGDALLTPTRIYVKSCLAAIRAGGVRALAHITGGGLLDNIPRVVPAELGVRLEAGSWPVPGVFRWLADAGGIGASEMARTFNCGIGMVAIVAPEAADAVARRLADLGETVHRIGSVVRRAADSPEVEIARWDALWRG